MSNIIELMDLKTKPDIFHEYSSTLKSEKVPIVIDNGSYRVRVGWSTNTSPLLEFRNLIAKPRKDRKKDTAEIPANPMLQTGNDIVNIEAVRMQLKTQFDRNVVTHFYNQEHIFDYIFEHLNINNDGSVPHPIVLTETLANPNYCRQQINELLFECYGVPSLTYGIDSLFSLKHNSQQQDALIISFGYHSTHVIPVLDGRLQAENVRRINAGGFHIITYLYRLMQMKYPVHLNAITVSRMETLLHQHGSVPIDYQETLKNWSDADFYAQNVKKIQLPYTLPAAPTSALNAEQRTERRKELSRRLIESNARRAREKQIEDEQQLKTLSDVRELYECGHMNNFQKALQDNKLNNLQALDKMIATVRCRMERAKQKLEMSAEGGGVTSTPKEKPSSIAKPPPEISLEDWISSIKDKRSEILKRKQARKTRRQELAKRHTVAAQERMRIISQLARNEKGADEFGIDDNDWDVYKVINRDNDSDSEIENERILEYDNILKNYDPTFDERPTTSAVSAEHYQLHLGVETIRALEILFQPSLIGMPETGLAELINFVLQLFAPGEQQRLVNNVFMTGGCAQFSGLQERLSKELLEMRPFQSSFNIFKAQLPELDAWLGAIDFANSSGFVDSLTSKKDYEENGSEYFKTHCFSNLFFSTPRQ